jgi:DNA-binding MarR family transcriptional regulator
VNARNGLENHVLTAARDQGLSSVLFRNAIGRRLGLNIADWEALSFITMRGTATPTELARYTGLTSGSTTAMLDRLEELGYLRRKPNPDDRRGVLVEVSNGYREKAMPLVGGIQQAHRQLLAGYSEEELRTIADFLTRFTLNVTEQTKRVEGNSLPGR